MNTDASVREKTQQRANELSAVLRNVSSVASKCNDQVLNVALDHSHAEIQQFWHVLLWQSDKWYVWSK